MAFTFRVKVAVWVAEEPVPVTVIGWLPVAMAEVVETVRVDEAPAVTEVGLNEAVAPAGTPTGGQRDGLCLA